MAKPLKFKTPEDLELALNSYFDKTNMMEYTVTGLALVIGSKQLLQDYEQRDGYSEIVKYAKLRVENSYELSMRKTSRPGDIFALKNFGWTDKQDVNLSSDPDKPLTWRIETVEAKHEPEKD